MLSEASAFCPCDAEESRFLDAPSKVNPLCHSEERSDEESASKGEGKQMLRFAQQALGTFIHIGGPKADVTLGTTAPCSSSLLLAPHFLLLAPCSLLVAS